MNKIRFVSKIETYRKDTTLVNSYKNEDEFIEIQDNLAIYRIFCLNYEGFTMNEDEFINKKWNFTLIVEGNDE